jgi:predicted dehydrogenase
MKTIGIGVTGSGFMGRTHVDAANRLDDAKVIAIAGGKRAPQLAADYGAECVGNVRDLVARDDVDAIVITTPHWLHAEEAVAAAEAGKHVLVEKPMATSMADCDRMIKACESNGVVLSVGYHQRFRESNKTAYDLIQSGEIGPIRCIQTSALFDVGRMRRDSGFGGDWSWWKNPESLAHLINSAPHTIDLCRWWLGADIAQVAACSGTYRESDNPNENTTMALLSFTNGAACTFWSSSVLPDPGFPDESFRFRLMGDNGLIDLNPYGKLQITRGDKWETVFEQPPVQHDESDTAFNISRMQAYRDQMQAFLNSISGEPGGEGTAQDGRAGVAGVLAMLESSANFHGSDQPLGSIPAS